MTKRSLLLMITALAGIGFVAGRYIPRQHAKRKVASVSSRLKIGLDDVARVRGPVTALVTIVEFADFQCPFSKDVQVVLQRLMDEYPEKVRVAFRNLPMPSHAHGALAAEAGLAAAARGRFWEMHDKLFTHQSALDRDHLDLYAREVGLNLEEFGRALDAKTYQPRVEEEIALSRALGIQGTPSFVVNGRRLDGAPSYEALKQTVDEELAVASAMVAKGTRPEDVYAKLMEDARDVSSHVATAVGGGVTDVYRVPIGDAPVHGAKEPLVTIVEFADFECPLCVAASPTIKEIVKRYGKDVAVAFKHFPLQMHRNARLAAAAAEAAREQGKFWEMHDILLQHSKKLDRPELTKYAARVGLNQRKFEAALGGTEQSKRVERDLREGIDLGVRGTPTFFINGRLVSGARPPEEMSAIVEEELRKASQKVEAGIPRRTLYSNLIAHGIVGALVEKVQKRLEPVDGVTYRVRIGNSPSRGAINPLVTIVEFSDFQCPLCAEVEPTLARLLKEYPDRLRVVWKDLPLGSHRNAVSAAIAARAAGEQGKFWQMQRKLLEHQGTLERQSLERFATELKMDMERFRQAMDDPQMFREQIDGDAALARAFGVAGTPAFFINGEFLLGAESYDVFKGRVEKALRGAKSLLSKGTPKARLYEELMRSARPEPTALTRRT
jgi:protein-disulfide isomerase